MTKALIAVFLLVSFAPAVRATVGHGYGYCEQGGHTVLTATVSSTNKVQESYPFCTVKVYLTGTTTLANLFSDPAGTVPLSNPFTADIHGYYSFYTAFATYDINLSGSTIPAPFTLGGVPIGVGGGGGTPAGSVGALQYNNSGVFGGVGLGTTTTVYHGNAAGVGSFGSVNLATEVTGNLSTTHLTDILQAAQFPVLTGDITTTGGSLTTSLANLGTSGTCGDATHSCGLSIDAKGRISVHSNNNISGGGGGAATAVIAGPFSSLPVGCSAGNVWFATDKPLLQQLYLCGSANNWLQYIGLDPFGGLKVTSSGQLATDPVQTPTLTLGLLNLWSSTNRYGETLYPGTIEGAISLPESTVAGLPPATTPAYLFTEFIVNDGQNASDCTVGGGGTPSFCRSDGFTWRPLSALATPGANTTLSNLSTVTSVNADLIPQGALSLGGGGGNNSWRGVYIKGLGSSVGGWVHITTAPALTGREALFPDRDITVGEHVAGGTAVLGTTAITSGTCATPVNGVSPGGGSIHGADAIAWSFASDPTTVTGYSTGLTVLTHPDGPSGLTKFYVCNNTAGSITPGAMTLNWTISR